MDFKGINAKIDRASDQVQTLSSDIEVFCATIRRSIVYEVDRDAGEQKWIFRGATPEVPIEWSIRVGEVLYNLRSALDHLVWQLVLANGEEPTRNNQFPILNEVDEWMNRTENKLNGVSEKHRQMIRFLQPFNPFLELPVNGEIRPYNAQVLRTLHDLCNIDKHRHLNLICAATGGIQPFVFGENHPPRRPSRKLLQGKGRRGVIERETILLSFNDIKQEMKPTFVISVNFQCINQQTLTQNSVAKQLRECLDAVRGGCALFRQK